MRPAGCPCDPETEKDWHSGLSWWPNPKTAPRLAKGKRIEVSGKNLSPIPRDRHRVMSDGWSLTAWSLWAAEKSVSGIRMSRQDDNMGSYTPQYGANVPMGDCSCSVRAAERLQTTTWWAEALKRSALLSTRLAMKCSDVHESGTCDNCASLVSGYQLRHMTVLQTSSTQTWEKRCERTAERTRSERSGAHRIYLISTSVIKYTSGLWTFLCEWNSPLDMSLDPTRS